MTKKLDLEAMLRDAEAELDKFNAMTLTKAQAIALGFLLGEIKILVTRVYELEECVEDLVADRGQMYDAIRYAMTQVPNPGDAYSILAREIEDFMDNDKPRRPTRHELEARVQELEAENVAIRGESALVCREVEEYRRSSATNPFGENK